MFHYRDADGDIWGFSENQLDLVRPDMVLMTELEVDQFKNPQNYWTDDEEEVFRLSQLRPLTRRQFMRVLVLSGYDLSVIETQINQIEDVQTRQLALIDWTSATDFNRNDSTLLMMAGMLGLTSEQVDQMWQFGSTL